MLLLRATFIETFLLEKLCPGWFLHAHAVTTDHAAAQRATGHMERVRVACGGTACRTVTWAAQNQNQATEERTAVAEAVFRSTLSNVCLFRDGEAGALEQSKIKLAGSAARLFVRNTTFQLIIGKPAAYLYWCCCCVKCERPRTLPAVKYLLYIKLVYKMYAYAEEKDKDTRVDANQSNACVLHHPKN